MTMPLTARDAQWAVTFPQRITPLADEWLPGLVLRCDVANGWPAGTTARYVGHRGGAGVETGLDLPRLAAALALPLSLVAGTAVRSAVRPPRQRVLSGSMILSAVPLGPSPRFQVCPACLADNDLLARWLALPLLTSCPQHGVLLQTHCRCGMVLQAFRSGPPMRCAQCGHPWAALPCATPSSTQSAHDAAIVALYAALLAHPAPIRLSDVRYVVRCAAKERGLPVPPIDLRHLAGVVAALAAVGVPAQRLLDLPPTEGSPPMYCQNQQCVLFAVASAGNLYPCSHDDGDYYCAACGSLYLGARLFLSFDAGCAPEGQFPGPPAVARAQEELARWRQRLVAVCDELLAHDERISLSAAFARAEMGDYPHLYAHGVGLVSLVEEYARRQVQMVRDEGACHWAPPDAPLLELMAWWGLRRAHHGEEGHAHVRMWTRTCASNLTDAEWTVLQMLLPPARQRTYTERDLINAILYVVCTGTPWNELPYAHVVFGYYRNWRRKGMWPALYLALQEPREPYLSWFVHRDSSPTGALC